MHASKLAFAYFFLVGDPSVSTGTGDPLLAAAFNITGPFVLLSTELIKCLTIVGTDKNPYL